MSKNLLEQSNYFLKNSANLMEADVVALQDCIREHNALYYLQEAPVISDEEYDTLFHTLKFLEKKFQIEDAASPTQSIAVLVGNQFQKGLHKYPMLSLDNTYDEADLRDFEKRIRNILKENKEELKYYIEYKLDGLGLSLTYRDGKLVQALTRGNGVEGEDVTINAMQIDDIYIPKNIPFKQEIEIRGEILMSRKEFANINIERYQAGEKLFANPRNIASGSLRQLNWNVTKSRKLLFYAYSFPYLEVENNRRVFEQAMNYPERIDTYDSYIKVLSSFGFKTQSDLLNSGSYTIDEILDDKLEFFGNYRAWVDVETDGLVIKLNNLSLWGKLGMTEHHPRYAIAYKFPAQYVRTRLLDIEHSPGRTGAITPVAILEPVNVTGVTVSRATLHNYDELRAKDIMIGDNVFIVRAGEVIPEVISVIAEARDGTQKVVEIPTICPSCQTPLTQDAGKVAIYCPNRSGCPAQIQGKMETFVSKHAMNIEGLGKEIIALFLEREFVTDFASIFHLSERRAEVLTLEGFKDKKIDNILGEIEKNRHIPLANLLVGLGIPQVGRKTAKLLATHVAKKFNTENGISEKEALLQTLSHLQYEELQEIKDIGPVAAGSIVYYFEENENLISNLIQELDITLPKVASNDGENASGKLAGKSFCVTGSFDGISRDEIHEKIEVDGGEVRTSVTKNLSYLVVGADAGSKLEKARSLGVETIGLEELMEMLG